MTTLMHDAPERAWQPDSYPGRIGSVAKISVSLPDDLIEDLKDAAYDNVSAFVATAVRHELDRRRLSAFVSELEDELGPADEAEVARYTEMFTQAASAAKQRKTRS